MKMLPQVHNTDKQKGLILFGLYFFAAAIALSGTFFCIYSSLNNVSFQILNIEAPGMIFGLVVVYFGIRSILSVNTLKAQLYKDDAKFSWNNFKRPNSKNR
jgi:hypothetical protein